MVTGNEGINNTLEEFKVWPDHSIIVPLTAKLATLECLKISQKYRKIRFHARMFLFDQISIKLACKQDRHKKLMSFLELLALELQTLHIQTLISPIMINFYL